MNYVLILESLLKSVWNFSCYWLINNSQTRNIKNLNEKNIIYLYINRKFVLTLYYVSRNENKSILKLV